MDITNDTEKEKLFMWSGRKFKEDYRFPEIDIDKDSYFIKRENNVAYIKEYTFETLPELKAQLKEMWSDKEYLQDILQVVLVAAMRNKPHEIKEDETKDEKLPTFIYNF